MTNTGKIKLSVACSPDLISLVQAFVLVGLSGGYSRWVTIGEDENSREGEARVEGKRGEDRISKSELC